MSRAADPFVVVPCSGSKAAGDHLPARDRYVGSFHRLALRAALAIAAPDHVRIASGRYGLLRLDDDTELYDQPLAELTVDEARLWRTRVQIAAGDIWNPWCTLDPAVGFSVLRPDAPKVHLLTPALYSDRLREASHFIAKCAVLPFAGCSGVGAMRHVLATIISEHAVATRP